VLEVEQRSCERKGEIMKGYYDKPCPCGSGELRYPLKDGAGLFLTYVCDRCEESARKRYNPDIWNNPHYCATGDEEALEIDYDRP